MTKTQPAPDTLISPNGQPIYGHFDGIPKSLGVDHFDYRTCMDRKFSRLAKYFHFKRFQFVSIVTPEYLIGIAIADIRYLGSAFCYVYDTEQQTLTEERFLRPLDFDKTMACSPFSGTTHIASSKLVFSIEQGLWRIKANTQHLKLDVCLLTQSDSLPLSVNTPTGYSGWTYTQKHNALKVAGTLSVNNRELDLDRALASYDYSAGFMRRETSWRWASLSFQTSAGLFGFNLAAGVNETGSTENVFWVNGHRHHLGPVHFHFDRLRTLPNWHIYSEDGRVNLSFNPLYQRSEKRNLIILKSNFRQFIGMFSGSIQDEVGQRHDIDQAVGLTEDHFARW
ncbi:DUF2804 domain-containing protein [Vibrio ostreicida]|uniref:DUF2804 domain-containing protein n=1 Tax=Vibrio ostreicida TaxID=526588 RepID=A0ABT8BW30_9VIBR|nr:DUF2804 domain-containing protein [Vibrio ostreicida]MDN3610298.1 DUF2804 domain-containing protein [Vibrio ostreicida]NPD07688.1 DUF2804 domain-containing protein [Vibrio ostreicida]